MNHAHHWVLPSPDGPEAKARCKTCDATKLPSDIFKGDQDLYWSGRRSERDATGRMARITAQLPVELDHSSKELMTWLVDNLGLGIDICIHDMPTWIFDLMTEAWFEREGLDSLQETEEWLIDEGNTIEN